MALCRYPFCTKEGKPLHSCLGCNNQLQRYCDYDCQMLDWNLQHKHHCLRLDRPAAAGDQLAVQGCWVKCKDQDQATMLECMLSDDRGMITAALAVHTRELREDHEDQLRVHKEALAAANAETSSAEESLLVFRKLGGRLRVARREALRKADELQDKLREAENERNLIWVDHHYSLIKQATELGAEDAIKDWVSMTRKGIDDFTYLPQDVDTLIHTVPAGAPLFGIDSLFCTYSFFATKPFGICQTTYSEVSFNRSYELALSEKTLEVGAGPPHLINVEQYFLVLDFPNANYFLVRRSGWAPTLSPKHPGFERPRIYVKQEGEVVSTLG